MKVPMRVRPWRAGRDQGSAAVEMALVLPLLLFVILALVDFGRAFDTKIQLSQAAREGVRLVAMQSPSLIPDRIRQAAPSLTINCSAIGVSCPDVTIEYVNSNTPPTVVSGATSCSSAGVVNARVTVKTDFTWITGITAMSKFFGPGSFPTPTQQSAVGVMQCS